MVDMSVIERLRQDAAFYSTVETGASRGALLSAIERVAHELGRKAPEFCAETNAIIALAGEAKDALPARDEIVEAIEDVCGDDLSGCCVSRIADAVMKLLPRN
jgi:hypothetical protein